MLVPLLGPVSLLLSILSDDDEDRIGIDEAYQRACAMQSPDVFIRWFRDRERSEQGYDLIGGGEGLAIQALYVIAKDIASSSSSLDELLPRLQWLEDLVDSWNRRWSRIEGHRGIVLESYSLIAPAEALFPPMRRFADLADRLKGAHLSGILEARFRDDSTRLPSFDGANPIISINGLANEIFDEITRRSAAGSQGVWSVREREKIFDSIQRDIGAKLDVFLGSGDDFPVYSFDSNRVLIRRISSTSRTLSMRRAGDWAILDRPAPSRAFEVHFADPIEE